MHFSSKYMDSSPRPNSDLLVEGDVGYAAWLLRPEALGAWAQNDISVKFIVL